MEKYSDIDIFLQKNDLSNDISFKTDIYSVSQSLTNIALTKPGERVFSPDFGTNLLETTQNGSYLQFNIEKQIIKSQLESQEPRAIIDDILLEKNNDVSVITIYFSLKQNYTRTGIITFTV